MKKAHCISQNNGERGGGGGCASNIKYIQLFYEKYDFTELVEHMNKMFKCFYHK